MGNNVNMWFTSQSSMVATNELRSLATQGYPGVGHLIFNLTGDPNNPNGGILSRFTFPGVPDLTIPGLGITFDGSTPTGTPYSVNVFTNQYDAIGNFPRYVLNPVADLNAFLGFAVAGQHNYGPGATLNWIQLPTDGGTAKFYYSLDTGALPLTVPERLLFNAIGQPKLGAAVGDLVTPDLRVLSDMGYNNWGTGNYANTPTSVSLLEAPNVPNIAHDLAIGSAQGPQAFLYDLGFDVAKPTGYPFTPTLNPSLNY